MKTEDYDDMLLNLKRLSRWALGLIWVYEGLVPKVLYAHTLPVQAGLVERSGIYHGSPEETLIALGFAQAAFGVILLVGWAERAMAALATLGMGVLIFLVAGNKPDMLVDPFGALIKDLALIACAITVWKLAPLVPGRSVGR